MGPRTTCSRTGRGRTFPGGPGGDALLVDPTPLAEEDQFLGGSGRDSLDYGGVAGDDTLRGGEGVDFIDGGDGDDLCSLPELGETVQSCETFSARPG